MNATARIEALTKYSGVQALATREFCQHLSQTPDARLIDRVIVKGKSVPLELFELRHKFSPPNFEQIAHSYRKAFAMYEAGAFALAEAGFREIGSCDRPSAVMAQRCVEFVTCPPASWSGIFAMPTK
jgi:adenylate cyclase